MLPMPRRAGQNNVSHIGDSYERLWLTSSGLLIIFCASRFCVKNSR